MNDLLVWHCPDWTVPRVTWRRSPNGWGESWSSLLIQTVRQPRSHSKWTVCLPSDSIWSLISDQCLIIIQPHSSRSINWTVLNLATNTAVFFQCIHWTVFSEYCSDNTRSTSQTRRSQANSSALHPKGNALLDFNHTIQPAVDRQRWIASDGSPAVDRRRKSCRSP